MTKLYAAMAGLILARENCERFGKHEWKGRHTERLLRLVKNYMPSGSGLDTGTEIDMDKSEANKLVFNFSFHHMDEHGGYDGWTEHYALVKPSLYCGIRVIIGGRDRNQIKEYLHEVYETALHTEIDEKKEFADELES